jgi:glutathione peroxidase
MNFGVTFPLFSKVDVNGKNAHPLFQYLTEEAPGVLGMKAVKWNFTKFLVNRSGEVVERYAPNTNPIEISEDIEKLI